MLSKSKKFIFIEIYRSGSRSVIKAIDEYEYKENFYEKLTKKANSITNSYTFKELPGKHSTYKEYLLYLNKKYYKYYSFAFSRNPYSWQVSMFHYMKEQVNHPQHEIIKKFTFDEYISWRCNFDFNLQSNFIFDEQDKLQISFLGKLENINNDFADVCKTINIDNKLPHINESKHVEFKNYYSSKSEKLISKFYEKDFDLLKYQKKLYS